MPHGLSLLIRAPLPEMLADHLIAGHDGCGPLTWPHWLKCWRIMVSETAVGMRGGVQRGWPAHLAPLAEVLADHGL